MNRFIYYLIFLNMMGIITTPIPSLLLGNSHNGAVSSMILSFFVGMIFTFIIIKFFNSFPERDMTELMKAYAPSWFRVPVTIYFVIMWYLAGVITLITLAFLLITFLTPEMSIFTIALSILITVTFGVLLKSRSVLYATEIILLTVLPIAFFLFIKLYSSSELEWDQVRTSLMYSNSMPSYSSFNTAIFAFTGVVNLIVFNRYFRKRERSMVRPMIIIAILAIFTLMTTYFIPIGLNGFDQVEKLIFPWTSAADSVRMKYGLVERIVFLFMLFFVTISFMSIIIHWHVAYKLLQSLGRIDKLQFGKNNWTPFVIVFIFGVIGIILSVYLTQHQLNLYASYFYNSLPIFMVIWICAMLLIKRGART